MPKYSIIIKHIHFWQHQIEAPNREEAIRKIREEESNGDEINVDEFFGDWQEMAMGEVVSVEKVEDGK